MINDTVTSTAAYEKCKKTLSVRFLKGGGKKFVLRDFIDFKSYPVVSDHSVILLKATLCPGSEEGRFLSKEGDLKWICQVHSYFENLLK